MNSALPSCSAGRGVRLALGLLALAGTAYAAAGPAGDSAAESPAAILQDLRRFREMGRVLYVAAHPDDENTLLIAYLARGRDYRTAYLSLTRGGGGQNVLGPQFGDELGAIRTEELLAARRIDGGVQFFSRARDFGYSKSYQETLRIWNHQEVLADVVRVIREFRPDVVITRFPPWPSHTHGHHTASAVLAVEAFKLAGDPKAFPDQLKTLTPWQPVRILWNSYNFGRAAPPEGKDIVHLTISGTDPVSGESFEELAGRSRSMHKTQGFGNFRFRGGNGPRTESFQLLGGKPATKDIMDDVDTTWARVPGGAAIGRDAGGIIAKFDPHDPAASVPALLALRRQVEALKDGPIIEEKRQLLDRIVQACLGLDFETTLPDAEVVPGEPMHLRQSATLAADVPVRWVAVRFPSIGRETRVDADLHAGQPAVRETVETLPAGTAVSQPYWLREEGTPGMFQVDNPSLIGRPENPPVFPVEYEFEVGGQTLTLRGQPVQMATDPLKGTVRLPLRAIPPISVKFQDSVKLFGPGASRSVVVEAVAARAGATGTVQLSVPAGWRVEPAGRPCRFEKVGDTARFVFTVTAPARPERVEIGANVEVGGVRFDTSRIVIDYRHIPRILLQPRALEHAVCLHLSIRGHRVGYLPGAGDSVAACLREMGYEVTPLTGADLTPERLKTYDAVVIGVRAFDVRTDLANHLDGLFAYIKAGGTVVEQYNRPGRNLKTTRLGPYPLSIEGPAPSLRVTNEDAPVTFLAPDHPVLNTPNKITEADFAGWVQERGTYFPSSWDQAHYTAVLAMSDPGEAPLKGSLLVARYGRGWFVYTGLVFFRQLPAGVPGAYRLFANLVSLGR